MGVTAYTAQLSGTLPSKQSEERQTLPCQGLPCSAALNVQLFYLQLLDIKLQGHIVGNRMQSLGGRPRCKIHFLCTSPAELAGHSLGIPNPRSDHSSLLRSPHSPSFCLQLAGSIVYIAEPDTALAHAWSRTCSFCICLIWNSTWCHHQTAVFLQEKRHTG